MVPESILRDTVEVEKNDYSFSSSDTLAVEHLGTCIGLGAHDRENGNAGLLHLGTLENDSLEVLLEEFLGELEPGYELLAGGTISSSYDPLVEENIYEQARDVVEEALEEHGLEYKTDWNDRPVYNRMAVSPADGIFYDQKL